MKWLPQQFNDSLALLLVLLIFGVFGYGLWAAVTQDYKLDGIALILGALITWGSLVVQFFFRKAPPPGGTEGGD